MQAEVKVYSDATMETEVTDSVTFSDSEERALYVNPVLSGSTTGVFVTTWTVTLGETPLTPAANGKIDLSAAENGQTLTIKAEHANYNFGDPVEITIIVEAPVADNFMVKDADDNYVCDLASPEGQLSLTFEEGATHQLWATAYNTGKLLYPQPTFTWENGVEKVVTVDANGKLSIVAAGEATLTVSVLDGEGNAIVTKTIAVTVEKAAAEVKVYKDAAMETAVTDSVTFSDSEERALYVKPVLTANGDVDVPVETWTVILDENTSLNVDSNNNNKIDLSDATDGQTLTIKAKHANYDFGENVEITINVEAAAKKDAELQAHLNDTFTASLTGPVTLDSSGNGALYVRVVDKVTSTAVTGATLRATVTNGSVTIDPVTGAVYISGASDNSVLTISSTIPEGYNTIQPLTIMLQRPVTPPVPVYGVNVWRTGDLKMTTVSSLTLGVDGTVGLTADVLSHSASDKGVTWSSDKPSVVSVSGSGYAATLTAKAVGTATITVASVDAGSVTHTITVSVVEPTDITFTARTAVYNKDLWGGEFASEARARYARMIVTVPTGTDLTQFTTISIKNSSGEFVVEEEPSTNYLTDVSADVAAWATQLREAGLLDSAALPVCFMNYVMPGFELGEYDITLKTLSGQEFTTSINIVDNDFYEDASWTTGSSEGLLIAKMPGMTNDLLVELVSGLKILKDGTHLLKDKGITDILVVDAETGNVYIKKEILDTLEAGTYSIGFTVVDNEELLNFTVVAADPAPDSEVRTLSTDVTISVGGVEKNQKIMVRDINNILSDDTQLYVDVASEAHDELDTPIFDVEHGFHYNIKLLDAAGNELPMPLSAKVELLFECVEGLDIGQLEIVLADSLTDTQFEEDYQTYGDVQYVGVLTNHFSPYSLFDIQTEDEKAALGKGKNNKTGDQAVQIAVAGLGSILVLALGIMLRLITSKKKFEE